MQYIYTTITVDMVSGQVLEKEGFWYDGLTELACGAGTDQKQIYNQQLDNLNSLSNRAQQIFGDSSNIFNSLTAGFEPIAAAGPGQNGFTAPELANLQSQAITQTGQAYRNAAQAAGERSAAAGGGNALLPSGTTAQLQANIAQAGAGQTANELSNINLQNAQVGRQNWLSAAGILSGAPNVFNPAISAGNSVTGAGSATANTANQIAQQDNSWMNVVGGALGGITSGLTSGLMKGSSGGSGGGGGGGFLPSDSGGWGDVGSSTG
jgi:hypothetical protein